MLKSKEWWQGREMWKVEALNGNIHLLGCCLRSTANGILCSCYWAAVIRYIFTFGFTWSRSPCISGQVCPLLIPLTTAYFLGMMKSCHNTWAIHYLIIAGSVVYWHFYLLMKLETWISPSGAAQFPYLSVISCLSDMKPGHKNDEMLLKLR